MTLARVCAGLGLVLAATLLASGGPARHAAAAPGWELAWSDEFDGPAGAPPDSARWTHDIGTDWGNDQLEYDTARPENVATDGAGHLVFTARRERWLGCDFTSGRIHTRGRFEQAGGRFEARMRLPRGRGLWPAFWLLGADLGERGWPACGEIDVLEYRGQEPHRVHGALHGPGYSGGSAVTRAYDVPGAPLDSAFHVYAVEWSPERITWFVDEVAWFTATPADLPAGTAWVFDHPFFVVLDLAVGGRFVGPPDASTRFPQRLVVDYVRAYRRKP